MANTYTLISSNVLGSAAASVTFSAIPSTYTDLVIRYSGRVNVASTNSVVLLTFNGTTTASFVNIQGRGSSGTNTSITSGQSTMNIGLTNGNSTTSNTFSSAEVYFPNYAGSSVKPLSSFAVTEDNNTLAFCDARATLQNQTTAINSITITGGAGDFMTGSSFYLYGISKN